MIDLNWLTARLCDVVRAQIAGMDEAPPVPPAGERVWSIFLALNAARGGGGFGPSAISHQEIESYCRLYREPLRTFELDMIRAMDLAFLNAVSERTTKPGEPATQVSARPVSPALFDALFAGS